MSREKATSGDIRAVEYRSLAIHHVKMLSYGHKWLIMTHKGQNPGALSKDEEQTFYTWAAELMHLWNCVPVLSGTICQTQHVFKIKLNVILHLPQSIDKIELIYL